jgi:hypothetical protein
MVLMMRRGDDLLKMVKTKAAKRITQYRESLRQMAKDAEQGYNVDDTEVRAKLGALEEYYYKHFGVEF